MCIYCWIDNIVDFSSSSISFVLIQSSVNTRYCSDICLVFNMIVCINNDALPSCLVVVALFIFVYLLIKLMNLFSIQLIQSAIGNPNSL